jgi:hypothetical protein
MKHLLVTTIYQLPIAPSPTIQKLKTGSQQHQAMNGVIRAMQVVQSCFIRGADAVLDSRNAPFAIKIEPGNVVYVISNPLAGNQLSSTLLCDIFRKIKELLHC